jgi:hypothetical protein
MRRTLEAIRRCAEATAGRTNEPTHAPMNRNDDNVA